MSYFSVGKISFTNRGLEAIPEAKDLFAGIPPNSIKQQNDIYQDWLAANWSGI